MRTRLNLVSISNYSCIKFTRVFAKFLYQAKHTHTHTDSQWEHLFTVKTICRIIFYVSCFLRQRRRILFIILFSYINSYTFSAVASENFRKNVRFEHFQIVICLMQYSCTWKIIKIITTMTLCKRKKEQETASKDQRQSNRQQMMGMQWLG